MLLAAMRAGGVDYLFAYAGTDFPPIIEALARTPETGLDNAEGAGRPARDGGGGNRTRLPSPHRKAAGGGGARQCGARQQPHGAYQRGLGQCPASHVLGPHAGERRGALAATREEGRQALLDVQVSY